MEEQKHEIKLKKINEYTWEIPQTGQMKVPMRIYASEKLLEKMKDDRTLRQASQIAVLPGIQQYGCVMPDGHEGYGFPIGGVAALDVETGGISPGGIGFDINCGVRLLATNLKKEQITPKVKQLLDSLFKSVPAGLGSSNITVTKEILDEVLDKGAKWAVENGYGNEDDLANCESNGCMKTADASSVSDKAKNRGRKQLATLGSGNHFLEIQYVDEIFDKEIAKAFGFTEPGQVVIMIHCGSRGLGHQVCSDYLREMERTFPELLQKLPDRQLIYAPAGTKLCTDYLQAMSAAANFAWCNRHIIGHQTRTAFKKVFPEVEMKTVYDVAHNICKVEEHEINGEMKKVYLHRKGATRAFPPGHPELSETYQKTGQPILLPGSMGTASYVLVGTEEGMKTTFGSTAHGAGRVMSRHAALQQFRGEQVKKDLEAQGISLKSASWKGVAEEAPGVYKDIEEVAKVSHEVGIGRKVVRVKPMGCIKG
ncbi:MAG: RtcB family protein [Nanoarchaeota archaeon]|nr:RtcB family protein [Nanoarchaeota archaeon]MBU1622872.1 RtcB family protein [Nanoarchaeota archaeon]